MDLRTCELTCQSTIDNLEIAKVRLVRSAAANQPGNKANAPSALRPLISGTMHFNMVQPIDPDFPFNRI